MKTCKKCGVEKEEELFVYRLGKITGCCKECKHKIDKEYYKQNTEKVKEQSKKYYGLNRERISAYNKSEESRLRRERNRRLKGTMDMYSKEYGEFCSNRPQNHMMREKNNMWKGGEKINGYGYKEIYKPEHPTASSTGYVKEHRLVVEENLGRILDRKEVVHHIDGDKRNNHINNLRVMTHSEHTRLHLLKRNKFMTRKNGRFYKIIKQYAQV